MPEGPSRSLAPLYKDLGKRPSCRDYLYGPKGVFLEPDSLSRLIATHRAALRKVVVVPSCLPEKSQQELQQEETSEMVDYGYDEDLVPPEEPPAKRIRMQRRNSKTPAMLSAMAISASVVAADFLREERKDYESRLDSEESDCSWEGGLAIAEDLVRHLQSCQGPPL